MSKHGVWILAIAALGLSVGTVLRVRDVRADSPYYITNIGAQSGRGTIIYSVCVRAPSTNPPQAGAVTITDGTGHQHQVGLSLTSTGCGQGMYLLTAQFAGLSEGTVQFQAACVLLAPTLNAAGTPVAAAPGVACLTRQAGLVSNNMGDTVEKDCQVDVNPNVPSSLVGCSGPGVQGALGGGTKQQPTLTPTIAPLATPTAMQSGLAHVTSQAYFAEGYTGGPYQQYLSLLNPQAHSVHAQVTIYRADGSRHVVLAVRLEPLSRRTLDVNVLVPRTSTAIHVIADGPLVAERALYAGYGHIVAGAPAASRRWYLAEGDVGSAFVDGLRIFNPSSAPAAITVTAYRSDGAVHLSYRLVPATARLSVPLSDVAGPGGAALALQSNPPVIVEGVVSMVPAGGPGAAMALTAGSRTWYFPDGGTSQGNEESLVVFNPTRGPTLAHLRLVTSDGYDRPVTLRLRAYGRTVVVVQRLLERPGLAAVLTSDGPVVAQEIRYMGEAVAVVNGAAQPARVWGLADGYVGHGFKEWVTVLNPGAQPAVVHVRLIRQQGVVRVVVLQERPHQRDYLYVNDLLRTGPVAAVVEANRPVVAGRTVVFGGGKGLSSTTGVMLIGH